MGDAVRMGPPVPVAIVGGGACGTLLAWQLARRGLRCTLIDPAAEPGPGRAYETAHDAHLLNVRCDGMSADPEQPTHFLDWLRRDGGMPGAERGDFVPRRRYGAYLRALLAEAAPVHLPHRALTCAPDPKSGGYRLGLDDHSVLPARQVVLATGNCAPAALPGVTEAAIASGRVHGDAWAQARRDPPYAGIPADAPVALVGTGLTAVDAILALRAGGHRGPLHALSRRGLLPHAHVAAACTPAPVPPVISLQAMGGAPTAAGCLSALRAAVARGLDWRAAIDSLRPCTNALWAAAPQAERNRFRRHLRRHWDTARHRMAPEIARVIGALRADGTLRLHRMRVDTVTCDDGGLEVRGHGPDGPRSLRVAHVLNCTGPCLHYARSNMAPLAGLLAAGIVHAGSGGTGLMCDAQGRVAPELYAIGPLRLGRLFESIAIPDLRCQARDLAELLAADLGSLGSCEMS